MADENVTDIATKTAQKPRKATKKVAPRSKKPVGQLAAEALAGTSDGKAEHLPGTDHALVKFKGMSWETLGDLTLNQEVDLRVKGKVVLIGDEILKTSGERKVAKVDVTSVTRYGEKSTNKT